MEMFFTIGAWIVGAATGIVAIWKACEYLAKVWRWFRSWKIVKKKEFERLKAVDAEHERNRPLIEREQQRIAEEKEKASEVGRHVREYLERVRLEGEQKEEVIRVDSDWDSRFPETYTQKR